MPHHRPLIVWTLAAIAVACAGCSPVPTQQPTAVPAAISEARTEPTNTLAADNTPAAVSTLIPTATSAPPTTPRPAARTPVRVFCAGSLMIPFAALEPAFEAANPDLDMLMEAHGSIQVIRHVTDIHEEIDVVASADHRLLSLLMYNTLNPDSGQPYARWNIRFATNKMALAYGPHSQYADELTSDNWAEIVSRPGVRVGLADPRFDACGYRQLMVLQLAEGLYDRKTLFEDMLMGRFVQPITAEQVGDQVLIHVPEVLEPRSRSTIVMRGSSVQLIPLLQSGDVDYVFEYESVVQQHNLSHITLPDGLNLGSPEFEKAYGQVAVKLDFRRFSAVEPLFPGEVIAYGLTIPTNAPQPDAAARLVAFALGPEGHRIMAESYHPLLEPLRADHLELLPPELAALCQPE